MSFSAAVVPIAMVESVMVAPTVVEMAAAVPTVVAGSVLVSPTGATVVEMIAAGSMAAVVVGEVAAAPIVVATVVVAAVAAPIVVAAVAVVAADLLEVRMVAGPMMLLVCYRLALVISSCYSRLLMSQSASLSIVPHRADYKGKFHQECVTFVIFLHGELALKTARESGQRSAEAYTLASLGHYLGRHGEYARALELVQASLALAEQIEHRQWMTFGYWELGVLYLELLALPEALQQLEYALALAHEVGSWNWIRITSGFLARAYLLQHDLTKAESILTAALEPDAAMQTIGQRLVWAARAELALARSDPVLALDITERLIASAANLSDEHVIPRLWKLRGEALAALHRTAEAETMLRAAQAAAHAQGLRPLLWRISVALGGFYQNQGRLEEAEQAFATARTIIEELAASVPDEQVREQFFLQATAMLPQKRTLPPDRAAKQAFGGLTTREREVAAFIAQGKSNREIAQALVVSERTVETHVSNIMFKLDVRSRRQLGAWAVEKGLVFPTL